MTTLSSRPRQRRGGRPTLEEAARLDLAVRESALALFLEHGYDATSMAAIARAADTTKASLYARFASKEAVFTSVLEWATARPDWPVSEPETPDLDDLEGALTKIADAAIRRALDPSMVKLSRIATAQIQRFPDLARRTLSALLWPRYQMVADLLRRHHEAGDIVAAEPEVLAEHFLAMVSVAPARLASYGIVRDPETQTHHTRVAVGLFVRALQRP